MTSGSARPDKIREERKEMGGDLGSKQGLERKYCRSMVRGLGASGVVLGLGYDIGTANIRRPVYSKVKDVEEAAYSMARSAIENPETTQTLTETVNNLIG